MPLFVKKSQLSNPAKMGGVSLCYLRWLPDTSEEIGSKNWFVFRYFFVNYDFDRNEIIMVNGIVNETLATTTVADAQRRTRIIVVGMIGFIANCHFIIWSIVLHICTRQTRKQQKNNWQYEVCKFHSCKSRYFI